MKQDIWKCFVVRIISRIIILKSKYDDYDDYDWMNIIA